MDLQVEYYYSDENLQTDKYMLSFIKKNKEGFGKSLTFVVLIQFSLSYLLIVLLIILMFCTLKIWVIDDVNYLTCIYSYALYYPTTAITVTSCQLWI